MDQRKGDWLEHGGSEEADCDMSEVDREREGRGREGNPGVPVFHGFLLEVEKQ